MSHEHKGILYTVFNGKGFLKAKHDLGWSPAASDGDEDGVFSEKDRGTGRVGSKYSDNFCVSLCPCPTLVIPKNKALTRPHVNIEGYQ